MTSFLYLAGQYANVIEQALTVGVSDEDGVFTRGYLSDAQPGQKFKFGTNGADRTVTVDLNRVVNGGFETSPLVGWTPAVTGTGATSEENTIVNSGAHALKCTAGTGSAAMWKDIPFRSGQRLFFIVPARGASSGTARVRIQNLNTGRYLNSSGNWQAASTDAATTGATTYTPLTLPFIVESWAVCQASQVTLRVTLACEGATGIAYFDDVVIAPQVNFCGVFGHNLAPVVAPQFRSSTDNFGGTDTLEATLAIQRPSFYGYLPIAVSRRYWRLKLSGTNIAIPWLGELVMGYAETIARGPDYGFVATSNRPVSRFRTPGGKTWVYGVTADEIPSLKLSFRDTSDVEYSELRDDILRRCGWGEFPIVVAPSAVEAFVMHGRVMSQAETTRLLLTDWDTDIVIEGSGLPTS